MFVQNNCTLTEIWKNSTIFLTNLNWSIEVNFKYFITLEIVYERWISIFWKFEKKCYFQVLPKQFLKKIILIQKMGKNWKISLFNIRHFLDLGLILALAKQNFWIFRIIWKLFSPEIVLKKQIVFAVKTFKNCSEKFSQIWKKHKKWPFFTLLRELQWKLLVLEKILQGIKSFKFIRKLNNFV